MSKLGIAVVLLAAASVVGVVFAADAPPAGTVVSTSAPASTSAPTSASKPALPPVVLDPVKLDKIGEPTVATTDIAEQSAKDAQKLINDGIAYLLSKRESDGGWSAGNGAFKPAITALVLKVLVQHPDFKADSPVVKKGFQAMLAYRQKDGGIYDPKMGMVNYTTALAVMALAAAQDPQYAEPMRDAVEFLRKQQIVAGSETPDGQKVDEKSGFFGGVSYGKDGRPDLSNVGFWMEAMHDAGVKGDDPAMQKALLFVSRCQNRSESNEMGWAKEGEQDQGFIYAPMTRTGTGESKAGVDVSGKGLRSYGSMTYVGFKSMLYADVKRDDPRVKGAFTWIKLNWRLDSNPNLPQKQSLQGLYYYYLAYAKGLRAYGEPVITDIKGAKHNWRDELVAALKERAQKDGSWANDADRWEEGSPVLVTGYAVTALQEVLKK